MEHDSHSERDFSQYGEFQTLSVQGPSVFESFVCLGKYTTEERNALVPVPVGSVVYNVDTGFVDYWNGSAWLRIEAEQAPFPQLPTAKGALPVGNGTSSVALSAGTDNQVLAVDSTTSTGLRWITPAHAPVLPTTVGTWAVGDGVEAVPFSVVGLEGYTLVSDPQYSTGMKWAASPLIPVAKGAWAVGDGDNTAILYAGNDGQVLVADSTQPLGVKWTSESSLPTTKGAIPVGNGTASVTLVSGANDQVLTVDSTTASGLKWSTPEPVPVLPTAVGAWAVGNGVEAVPFNPTGLEGYTIVSDAQSPVGMKWVEAPFIPVAKGAWAIGDGDSTSVLYAGDNGQVLTADSAQPLGVKWSSGTSLPTAKGTIPVGSGTASVTLASGTADQVLTVDPMTESGLKWATPASAAALPTSYGTFAVGNGTSAVPFGPPQSEGYMIVSDGQTDVGMKWLPAPFIPIAKGAWSIGNGTDTGALFVGSDGQVLTADSTQPLGVKWGTNVTASIPSPYLWEGQVPDSTTNFTAVSAVNNYPIALWTTTLGNDTNHYGAYYYRVPVAGAWIISADVSITTDVNPASCYLSIAYTAADTSKTDAVVARGTFPTPSTGTAGIRSQATSSVIYNCSVGDQFRVFINLTPVTQTTAYVLQYSSFKARFVGAYQ